MDIDIRCDPPSDVLQGRKKYVRIVVCLLALVASAVLIAVYGVLSDTAHGDKLEKVALVLFIVPGFVFVYYAEKLQAYKRLTPQQEKEMAGLCNNYPDIATYCDRVSKMGRKPVLGEYEACKEHADVVAREEKGRA